MLDPVKFIDALEEICGIKEYTGVPCSNLKYLINYTKSKGVYTEAPNEGEAVAYSVGHYLGNKQIIGVMIQNSGLTNAMNAITSLAYINRIPQLYLIGYRGSAHADKDEPQHEMMGDITESLCITMKMRIKLARYYEDEVALAKEIEEILDSGTSVSILIEKGQFIEFEEFKSQFEIIEGISRDDVLKSVSDARDKDTIVVTTTGFTSRAMYDKFGNSNNFYMVGSMGDALTIGCGLAKSRPDKKVIVIDGDGAIMMRPQSVILAENLNLPNLCHVVIENGKYESTGNQYCPGFADYNLEEMLKGLYNEDARGVRSFNDLRVLNYFLDQFMKGTPIGKFLIMKVNTNSNDNNLGRPKESTVELRDTFMKSIGAM